MSVEFSRRELISAFGLVLMKRVPALARAQSTASREAGLLPINFSAVAKRVVSSLQPAAGERAVIVYDPAYYPELTREVEAELDRAGVSPILVLTFESPEIIRSRIAKPENIKKAEEKIVSLLLPVFKQSQIFLWMPARQISPDLRWERLVDASPVRGIHFHWIMPLTGRSPEETQTLTRMYERAILETDYERLSKEQDRLMEALRGRLVQVTTPDGTDLRMRVPGEAWFHKNDGDMSPSRARLARSARDREMEFPSGALRFIPDVASVEGRLSLRRAPALGPVEGITIEFEKGRAVHWKAEKNEPMLQAGRDRMGGDIDKVGEIVIGANPLLVGSVPSGDLPYYGYGSGYVRVSLGDNWESGGANRSPGGRPLWLFLEKATLKSGNQELVRAGSLAS